MYISIHLALPCAFWERYWLYKEALRFSQRFNEVGVTALATTHVVNDPRRYCTIFIHPPFHPMLQYVSSVLILTVDHVAAYKFKVVWIYIFVLVFITYLRSGFNYIIINWEVFDETGYELVFRIWESAK